MQKTHTAEFKREAVRLAQISGKTTTQYRSIRTPINQPCLAQSIRKPPRPCGHQPAQEEEIHVFKRVEGVKQERDLLKKKTGRYLSRPQP